MLRNIVWISANKASVQSRAGNGFCKDREVWGPFFNIGVLDPKHVWSELRVTS